MKTDWLYQPIGLGILWAELLGALAILCAVALAAAGCRPLFRRLDQLCEPFTLARPLQLLVRALEAPLLVAMWVYGVAAAIHLLLPPAPALPQLILQGVAHGIGILVAGWLVLRLSRRLTAYLDAWAARRQSVFDRYFLPLFGRSLPAIVPVLAVFSLLPLFAVPNGLEQVLRNLASLLLIGAVAWVLIQVVSTAEQAFLDHYQIDIPNNLEARRVHTQVGVIRKITVFVIVLLALACMLMVFDKVRQLGASILASAGIMGVVLGFAAQRVLGNLLAGIQIALTQPIRLDDAVIVEGEFGNVEELTLTYVVLRLWDQRRLVLPITYFIEKPFQNWTRSTSELLGTVFLFVDYSVPIEALRTAYERIVKASPLWDGRVCVLQVFELTERTVQLRGLVSARNSANAGDLRAHVREALLAYLHEHHPQALPKLRTLVDHRGGGAGSGPREPPPHQDIANDQASG